MIELKQMWVVLAAILILGGLTTAQDEKKKTPRRFGFDVDETTFPQQNPPDAIKSISRALDRKKVDYLLAHMADPAYVDYWVDRYKDSFPQGNEDARRLLAFERLVRETDEYFQNDPLIARDLRIFAKDARWAQEGETAVGTTDKVPARKVFLKKIADRWFLENRQQ